MKTKLVLILTMLSFAVTGKSVGAQSMDHSMHISSKVVAVQTDNTVPHGDNTPPQEASPEGTLQAYAADMSGISDRFSSALQAITEAVKRGDLTREQGQKASTELYEITVMQIELLDAWRDMSDEDESQKSTPSGDTPDEQNDIVMVALPFSSLRRNAWLALQLKVPDLAPQ